MKKIINPWRNHDGYNCFGCSPDNPIGLHLEFYEDGDYIVRQKMNSKMDPMGRAIADYWKTNEERLCHRGGCGR